MTHYRQFYLYYLWQIPLDDSIHFSLYYIIFYDTMFGLGRIHSQRSYHRIKCIAWRRGKNGIPLESKVYVRIFVTQRLYVSNYDLCWKALTVHPCYYSRILLLTLRKDPLSALFEGNKNGNNKEKKIYVILTIMYRSCPTQFLRR